MSTYTCPHCGEHDLSTQKRHNCPKLPSLGIPLGPPRSMDPCANEYIARLTRELEEAREIIRDLVDREPICVALRAKYVEVRIDGGTWDDARRFVGLDRAGDDETM